MAPAPMSRWRGPVWQVYAWRVLAGGRRPGYAEPAFRSLGGAGDDRTGGTRGGRPGPPAGVRCRPRAGGRGAQDRVRAGPPHKGRAGHAGRTRVRLADLPARPRPKPRPDWPPPELPASRTARRPANHWVFKWALALATIGLPTLIAAALVTGS